MENHTKIISVVGLPAVGKTTAISILKDLKPDWSFYSTEMPDKSKKIIQSLHREKQVDYALIQDKYFENLINHSAELEHLLKKATNTQDLILLDRGFEDTLACTEYFAQKGYLRTNDEYSKNYKLKLSKYFSDLVIFLIADIEIIKFRQIGRDIKLGVSKRPIDDFFINEISNFYVNWYKTNTKSIFIETSNLQPIEVSSIIISTIEKECINDI